MQRKTGYNQFPHPEVLSATADPIFFFISVIFVFSNVATLAEKKNPNKLFFYTTTL